MSTYQEYFTVNQVAERYEIHEATVRKWLRAGVLSGIQQGSVLRISKSSLLEFEELSRTPANKRFS